MKNFEVEFPGMEDGRCRVCDFRYALFLAREVDAHQQYHRLFLRAKRAYRAPMPRTDREQLRKAAREVLSHPDFLKRVGGAEDVLMADYHDHLENVLRHGGKPLDFPAYIDRRDRRDDLVGWFDGDVTAELRRRYTRACLGRRLGHSGPMLVGGSDDPR